MAPFKVMWEDTGGIQGTEQIYAQDAFDAKMQFERHPDDGTIRRVMSCELDVRQSEIDIASHVVLNARKLALTDDQRMEYIRKTLRACKIPLSHVRQYLQAHNLPCPQTSTYAVVALEKFLVTTTYEVAAYSKAHAVALVKAGKVAYDEHTIEEGGDEYIETKSVDFVD